MANVVTFMLPEIEIYENHVKDALRSILHTIIVNRSIGPLHTRMMPCELFGLNYATTNHPDEKQNVDSAIGRFQTIITRSNNNLIKEIIKKVILIYRLHYQLLEKNLKDRV